MSERLPDSIGLCPICVGEFHIADPEPGERCPHAGLDHDCTLVPYVRARPGQAETPTTNPARSAPNPTEGGLSALSDEEIETLLDADIRCKSLERKFEAELERRRGQ